MLRSARPRSSELALSYRSQISALPLELLQGGLDIGQRIVLAPWRLCFAWAEWVAGFILRMLAMIDFLPNGFVPSNQVRQRGKRLTRLVGDANIGVHNATLQRLLS